jgi:hypothetical protein|tara:strand:- start:442 stop:1608 length:1167 start_codon:yes stop_codon:yes gene_type:complete
MSSRLIVNTIRHNGASSDAVTLASDGTCTANITNKPNRNLIINGAMQVAQRGTSSTSTGVVAVDRVRTYHVSTDEAPTYSQVDVASGTTPYSLGLRKAYRVTNGNQTSGVAATNQIQLDYLVEAQDLACSGWDHKSPSSFLTLSYWAKSSVAQEFKAQMRTVDGTPKNFAYSLGSLAANTWTKVTILIPGNSNLQIDNDNGTGLEIGLFSQWGTNLTANSVSENAWGAYSGSARTPDQTLTWYTTNDATFEITGVQLEVGSVATDFEHRSFGQELALCMRYYETHNSLATAKTTDGSITSYWSTVTSNDSNTLVIPTGIIYKVPKRASPTVTIYNPGNTATAARVSAQGTERTVTATYGGPNALTRIYVSGASAGNYVTYNWEASAEL